MYWKISKEKIEGLTKHLNSDNLMLCKAGEIQLVTGATNGYSEGDLVIVMPDKTIIEHEGMRLEEEKYLTGSGKKNRVRTVNLRGEISEGCTYPANRIHELYGDRIQDLVDAAEIGADLSELLEMTKYEAPIPRELTGQIQGIKLTAPKKGMNVQLHHHDCYPVGTMIKEFGADEQVLVFEKLHGSMINYAAVVDENQNVIQEVVTTKNKLKDGFEIIETAENAYWQAVRNENMKELVEDYVKAYALHNCIIDIKGELIPVQRGYTYGQDKATLRLFAFIYDGDMIDYDNLYEPIRNLWVPLIARGQLHTLDIYELAKGRETVSGKEVSIREGVVLQPRIPRKDRRGNNYLFAKVINTAYSKKENGEEFN